MRFRSTDFTKQLEKDLLDSGSGKKTNEHLSFCAKISALVFVFSWLGWSLFSESFIEGIAFSLVFYFLAFFMLVSKPGKELKLKARKIEKHLPFALMQMSIDLNTGVHFDKALERISLGEYGALSFEIKESLDGVRKFGSSVPRALLKSASRNRSKSFQRTVAQLISIYEHGSKKNAGEIVRRVALEQLARQKAEAKEFSGKIVVFSLAFIVVSAIVPALFQAFIIVGSSFIEIPFTAIEILVVVGFLFPLIDGAMLVHIKSKTPEFLKG